MAAAGKKQWDGDGVPLKDSNCAGIGSDEDKAVRKGAAQAEPAWKNCGKREGTEVWRIEQFQVKEWDRKSYGKFYKGDSYIVLSTYKNPETAKLNHQIYFWLGADTTTDEMGTAAYKTVELDDFFDGEPTQHREVQGSESQEFKKLFPRLTYMDGGTATGFRHSVSNVALYEHKLFLVRRNAKGNAGCRVTEVPLKRESLNQGDCFILDAGNKIYVWDGEDASPFEKAAANTEAEHMERERDGRGNATHEIDDEFWKLLGGKGAIASADDVSDAMASSLSIKQEKEGKDPVLYQISDAGGELEFKEVARGKLNNKMLISDDVMMVDAHAEIFLWAGKGASSQENRSCLRIAMDYLKAGNRPTSTPIHMFKEGTAIKNALWQKTFGAGGGGAGAFACLAGVCGK
jgi:gelsolin